MNSETAEKNKIGSVFQSPWFFLLVALALSLLIFRPWRPAEFLKWDDDVNISTNALIQPFNWQHLWQFWREPFIGLYIPVTYTIWGCVAAILQFFGWSSWPYVQLTQPFLLLNVLFHIWNGYLLFSFLKKLRFSYLASAFASLMFLLHPIQVESVVFITGFKEIIWVHFALRALCSFQDGHKKRTYLYTICALLCKPTAAILPFVFLLYQTFANKLNLQSLKKTGLFLLPLLALSVGVLILTKKLQPDSAMLYPYDLGFGLLVVFDTFGFYLLKLFWPFPLLPDYSRAPSWLAENMPTPEQVYAVLALILLGVLWRKYKNNREWIVLIVGLFTLPIMPVSGLVPFLQQNYSSVVDRYMYFPFVGVAVFLALVFEKTPWPRSKILLASALLVAFSVKSFVQTDYWTTNLALFSYTLEQNPFSFMSENHLGIVSYENGHMDQAIDHFQRSYALNPRNQNSSLNLARALNMTGNFSQAKTIYAALTESSPDFFNARADYGILLTKENREAEALPQLEAAVRLVPDSISANVYLGVTLCRLHRCPESLPYFTLAIKAQPKNREFQNYMEIAEKSVREQTLPAKKDP